jgi:hypothetical protein
MDYLARTRPQLFRSQAISPALLRPSVLPASSAAAFRPASASLAARHSLLLISMRKHDWRISSVRPKVTAFVNPNQQMPLLRDSPLIGQETLKPLMFALHALVLRLIFARLRIEMIRRLVEHQHRRIAP